MNTCLFLASDSPISKLNNVPWLFFYNGIVEFLSRLYYSVLVVLNDPVKLKEKTPHTIGTVWKNKQEEFYKALGSLHGHVFFFFFFFSAELSICRVKRRRYNMTGFACNHNKVCLCMKLHQLSPSVPCSIQTWSYSDPYISWNEMSSFITLHCSDGKHGFCFLQYGSPSCKGTKKEIEICLCHFLWYDTVLL